MKLLPLLVALLAGATPAGGRAPAARAEENPVAPGLAPSPALVRRLEKARAAKGAGFRPHTRHLDEQGKPLFTNRLILESSPYLLMHANNPVSWYAWGDEPFARAAREHKPVLLSIGYSTCHWCHVMERESFEDPEVARLLNERFIAIKVDREERPDVDGVYLAAVQLLTGSGGWPMTCVLTPERQPFFGGTYFPRTPFLDALKRLRRAYDAEPGRVARVAGELTRAVQAEAQPPPPGDLPGPEAPREAVERLARAYDPVNGGFGEAPRFPLPVNLELLLRFHRRTGDAPALQMAVRTLEAMARGGIYDQLGGGFHRYSTDARWLKPHFEKMLYDNAQLAEVYLEAWQLTGRADFARVVRETLDFVARDLADPRGGFWSASDADSAGPAGEELEGGFFTWTPGEIEAVLGKAEGAGVAAAYGVTAQGDLEGRSILRRIGEVPADARQRLFEARRRRAPPAVDRKIVTSWNGLLISALAKAGFALDEPRYTALSVAAAGFLLRHPKAHTWSDGRAQEEGYLDDGAALAQGLLDLYEATHDLRWLRNAIALQRGIDGRFHDPAGGGYLFTPEGKQGLIAREKPAEDGVVPSGNAIAARNLLRLAELTGDARFRRRAEEVLRAFSSRLQAMPVLLGALGWTLGQPLEVVVVLPPADPGDALVDVLRRTFLPDAVRAVAAEGTELEAQLRLVPLFEGRRALHGKATAYVCRSKVCDLPTSDPATLAKQLARIEPSSPQ